MSDAFAPGVVVVVRDEEWLITQVEETGDGPVISASGLSELVRGQDAVFYPALDAKKDGIRSAIVDAVRTTIRRRGK